MKLSPYGQRAWLMEVSDASEVRALDAALRLLRIEGGTPWSGILDVVPAARTVMVTTSSASEAAALRVPLSVLTDLPPQAEPIGATVEIPVTYDGPDLGAVARACGLSIEDVVAAHTSTAWSVAFGGFAPGFAYLSDGDPRLLVGRRDQPRISVPAGTVALADGFSAIYPRTSPGGWQLIGRTSAPLWDDHRAQPALLRPGMRVVFRVAP